MKHPDTFGKPHFIVKKTNNSMKLHYLLLFTLLFSLFTLKAQQCRDYTCALFKVERLIKQYQKVD
jgi:hypothetical protein